MTEEEVGDNLVKWLAGELSPPESDALAKEVDLSSFGKMVDSLDELEPDFEVDYSQCWQEVSSPIEIAQPGKRSVIRYLLPIAATLALLLGAFFLMDRAVGEEILASVDMEYGLPDASVVHLQKGSKLLYDQEAFTAQRTLHLEGSGYFEVSEGSQFSVETAHGTVTVLGTSFEIRETDEDWSVVCYTGKVRVTYASGEKDLLPAQRILVRENIALLDTDYLNQPVWVDGSFYLRSTSLQQVGKLLSAHFGISIVVDVAVAKNFGGYLDGSDLTAALAVLTETLDLQVERGTEQIRLYQ